jgi:hypothetical protein
MQELVHETSVKEMQDGMLNSSNVNVDWHPLLVDIDRKGSEKHMSETTNETPQRRGETNSLSFVASGYLR